MSPPVVSVVMAAYNGAALVDETIASLQAQTLREWELVVVDDRSTDATLAVLRAHAAAEPRIRVIGLQANGGPVRARNRAFAEARGRYVAGLDQDDLCVPERLAAQVAYLEAHSDTVLLGTQAAVLEDGRVFPSAYVPHTSPALVEWLLHIENPLVWSSVMVRADAARRLTPFTRPELLYAEDFDLYHRMAALGRIARLDAPLLIYRRHAGGASVRYTATMRESAARVLAERYRPLFGDGAEGAAGLVVRHLMGRDAPPDRAALAALGAVLERLQAAFFASRPIGQEDRTLIRWETARRWSQVARAGLRCGTLGLGDALAVRPEHLGLGYASIDTLVVSRLIGGARAARRRLAG